MISMYVVTMFKLAGVAPLCLSVQRDAVIRNALTLLPSLLSITN